ncbi:hypothetical protein P3T27_007392 [Kitasatospora sp. MAA19]|uniref:hypothetical protein n=1 Tax=unclassified Kitasatospora TaxID=2633591 RepID=UPI00247331A6|nr:hypothetical protein [Kitasatospora sp. MAA19]MDH6710642.1 hypothetical protein [Kitasatospora sp. MAA19]
MITSVWWRRGATTAAALALALIPAAAPAAAAVSPAAPAAFIVAQHRELTEPPPAEQARAELNQLVVEAPHSMEGYTREKFPHWIKQYGQCDTREVVLARDGQNVVQDELCRAVSGVWTSPYDDKTFTDAKAPDIDHMVSVAATT